MLLKEGSKGLAVVRLQLQLRHFDCYTGNINGIYDKETVVAVITYQTIKNIVVDGISGNQTNGHLKKDSKNAFFALFLHCAATAEDDDLGPDWVINLHTKKKGWSRVGYSDLITLDGRLHNLRRWDSDDNISEWEYTFGVRGSTLLNRNSRHVCYIGGVMKDGKTPKDTRTILQKISLDTYVRFALLQNPNIVILGHNQVQRKACPSFDVPTYLKSLNISDYNMGHFELYKQLY